MSTAKFSQWPNSFAGMAGDLVSLTGMVLLLGWELDMGAWKSVLSGWTEMAAIAALALRCRGGVLFYVVAKAPRSLGPLATRGGKQHAADRCRDVRKSSHSSGCLDYVPA